MSLGIGTCTYVDVMLHFGEAFAEFAPELTILREEEVEDPSKVDFAITFKPADDVFARYPNLKAVFSLGAGVDAILKCSSLPDDLPVFRAEDPAQAAQMAGFAAFHVVWHHRNMGKYRANQALSTWDRGRHSRSPGIVRVGIMGMGNMGRAVAKGLVTLGYDVATLTRSQPDPVEPGVDHFTDGDRDAFLKDCKILINILPLTPATRNFMDADLFAKLPEGAALIHLGRGEQMVEEDLIAALDSGHMSGASLDVFQTEPLPEDHPLWTHPKVFVTPHTACAPEIQTVVKTVQDGLAEVARGNLPPDRKTRGY